MWNAGTGDLLLPIRTGASGHRKAALDAGMIEEESSAKLVLCLEPEAACMACEEERLSDPGAAGNNVLKTDDNFMAVWSNIHPALCFPRHLRLRL